MIIPTKKPCPCGWVSPITGNPCPKFTLPPLIRNVEASVSEEEADEIIRVYKDAARFRFLIERPALMKAVGWRRLSQRLALIDLKMNESIAAKS